jgi:transcriptional regulator with XRE-family HTH domain
MVERHKTKRPLARHKSKKYAHQGLLPFMHGVEWKYRIHERFRQNRIHLKGMVDKPNSVMIELGSHRQSSGGLMITPHNMVLLARVFNISPTLLVQSQGRGSRFYFPKGDAHLVRTTSDSFYPEAYRNIRSYLGLSQREIAKRIGRADSIEFKDAVGKPVMVYRHYVRRSSPPSQAMLHRWFIDFFDHPLAIRLAEAIAERNAREAGPRYLAWAKKKASQN